MNISEKGLTLIKQFEGLRLAAYLCAAGVWTIGWGHTKGVKKGDKITLEQAKLYLDEDIIPSVIAVYESIKVPLTPNQFDALVSFTFNVGIGALKKSTLVKRINSNDPKASDEFLKWVKGGGKILPGLVTRRQAEKRLFDIDRL